MEVLRQDPTDPDFVQNPYPFYETARKVGPFFQWADYGTVCATSYEAVISVLKHRSMGREKPEELASTAPEHLRPFYDIEAHSMLELEAPAHTRLRGLVVRAFTSRGIAALAPDIERIAQDLVRQFEPEPFDLIEAFAQPLPVRVICKLLGVPSEHANDLLSWSNAMVAMYQAKRTPEIETAAVAASTEFKEFLTDYIAHRRKAPKDDLLSSLISAEQDGERLSQDELISTCILLLNAGHEATVHTIGNGVANLIPRGISKIDEHVIEEIIRFDPPLHMFTRWVYEDVSIAGQTFKRGDEIACLLAAGNRDPSAFPTPNEFVPNRTGAKNCSFGSGIHFCVGAPLARQELLIGLQTLFKYHPNLKILEAPKYANVYHFRGLERLMVSL